MKRVLPSRTAMVTALLVASFPMAIAYSRSAVEQSLMGVPALIAIYFALKNRWKETFAAFIASLLVHPVNIFLLPILLAPLVCHTWTNKTTLKRKAIRIQAFFLVFSLILVGLLSTLPPEYSYLNLMQVGRYLVQSPMGAAVDFVRFLLYYARLFTGVTPFEYFANPTPDNWTLIADILSCSGILLLMVLGSYRLWRSQQWLELSVVIGLVLSLLCFFVAAGPRALAPGLSRHSNYLTVPSAVVFAILLCSFQHRKWMDWGTATLALVLLVHFWFFYFVSVQKDGGGFTHRTYITGPVEPKKAVFDWIHQEHPAIVFVEDWWTYWPLKYLAYADRNCEVVLLDDKMIPTLRNSSDFIAVGSPGGPLAKLLSQMEEQSKLSLLSHFTAPAYGGKPALMAWKLQAH